jgi:hypothetical protein
VLIQCYGSENKHQAALFFLFFFFFFVVRDVCLVMDGEAARLSSDEIALQLQDKATFATALAALKKNITGPPSAIFTVPIVWPIFVSLSTNIVRFVFFVLVFFDV